MTASSRVLPRSERAASSSHLSPAAETGHLVLSTVHSSSCAEALNRVVDAFDAESQNAVRAQLADCLVAVVCQRLRYRDDLAMRVPECEILVASSAVRSVVRRGEMFKLASALESGGAGGNWSFARYAAWLGNKTDWHIPSESEPPPTEAEATDDVRAEAPQAAPPAPRSKTETRPSGTIGHTRKTAEKNRPTNTEDETQADHPEAGIFVMGAMEDDPEDIVRELEGDD